MGKKLSFLLRITAHISRPHSERGFNHERLDIISLDGVAKVEGCCTLGVRHQTNLYREASMEGRINLSAHEYAASYHNKFQYRFSL